MKKIYFWVAILVAITLVLGITGCKKAVTTTPAPTTSAPVVTTTTATTTAKPSTTTTAATTPAKEIVLKAIRPFPYNNPLSVTYRELIDQVNKKMSGRLKIQDMGGAEVYPTGEQLKPVMAGVVDLLNTPASYQLGTFPEGQANYQTFGAIASEKQSSGLITALDKMGRKNSGIAVIGAPSHYYFTMFTIKPVKSLDDLKSMKIRVSGTYLPVLQGLGVPTVTMPAGEVYTALQQGVVDGVAWANLGMIDYGWQEIVKYQIFPPLWSLGDHLLFMNAAKLDSLPADIKKEFLDIVRDVDNVSHTLFNNLAAEETKKLRQIGIKVIELTEAEWLKAQELQWTKGNETLLKLAPANYEELKSIYSKWYPPKAKYEPPYAWK